MKSFSPGTFNISTISMSKFRSSGFVGFRQSCLPLVQDYHNDEARSEYE